MTNDEMISAFCQNIKTLRKKCGYSKKDMAKKLGISVLSLSKIEGGSLPPRLDCMVLVSIYREFGITPKNIFER